MKEICQHKCSKHFSFVVKPPSVQDVRVACLNYLACHLLPRGPVQCLNPVLKA
uniref:Uncharacterized protein n=1 Tax=Anguilla anguilla TaxID=7936 RepID=A0A0E9QGH3_ANGAN